MANLRSAKIKAEAIANGSTLYDTGVPCRKGHMAPRFTANSTCVECDRAKYRAIADKRIVQMAEWRAANPDKMRDAMNAWKERNPDALKNHQFTRRARKAALGSGYTIHQVRAVLAAQGGRCANCRIKVGQSYHADHVMPLALGGAHDIKNIQILCPPCNHRKHKKDPIVWARQQGRLL